MFGDAITNGDADKRGKFAVVNTLRNVLHWLYAQFDNDFGEQLESFILSKFEDLSIESFKKNRISNELFSKFKPEKPPKQAKPKAEKQSKNETENQTKPEKPFEIVKQELLANIKEMKESILSINKQIELLEKRINESM